jgi:type IV pilus assembly protein PilE
MVMNAHGRCASAPGFTLVELMIVVAVIAILASIAYPSYVEQMRKSRRAQAKADLVEYAQLAERFHTVNNTYVGFDTALAHVSPREAGATARYTLAMPATQSTFTLTATAVGDQANDRCGNLSLNQAGVKTESGPASLPDCW